MQQPVRVQTLGGFRLFLAGLPAAAAGARSAEALLAYLAVRTRPVTREALAFLLWPDSSDEAARASLRTALHRLRALLGEVLVTSRAEVGLADAAAVDVREFEGALRQGAWAVALELYEGEFLAGFSYGASGEFEAWLEEERQRLRHLAITAAEDLLARQLKDLSPQQALRSATRLRQLEPLHEPALRAAMSLLARSGRPGEALSQYRAYVSLLREELGIHPSEETRRLAERLTTGAATMTASVASAPAERAGAGHRAEEPLREESGRGATPPLARQHAANGRPLRGEIPAPATPLIGRTAELAVLGRRLEDAGCRWVTVVGPGGAGKTRLALEAATRWRHLFADGVRFLPLAGVGSAEQLLASVAQGLDVGPAPGTELRDLIAAYLGNKSLLLVLDNLEQLSGATPQLAALLRHAPGVKVLATSRVRLHLPEEWLLPLTGLEDGDEAAALFDLYAVRVAPHYQPPAHQQAVTAIWRAVGGLPLALELAAGWCHALTPERIAAELASGPSLLAVVKPGLPGRQRSLEAVFDSSWNLLPEELRRAFARLAPFRGGFTTGSATEVAGVDLPQLLELTDRSLVRPAGADRFELHELLRHYAGARLTEMGEAGAVAQRHLHAFSRLADRVAAEVFGPTPGEWLRRSAAEQDNLRAALEWAHDHAPARAPLLLAHMAWFWRVSCALDEGRAWLRRGLARVEAGTLAAATLRYHLGHLGWMAADHDGARQHLTVSLSVSDALDPLLAAQVRSSLAMVAFSQGRNDEAAALLARAQEEFTRAGAEWWQAFAHGWRGRVAAAQGRDSEARREYERSLELFRSLDSAWGLGLFLLPAAELEAARGRSERARPLADTSVQLLSDMGFRHSLWSAHRLLAQLATAEGDATAALAHLRTARDICREIGEERYAAQIERQLSALGGS